MSLSAITTALPSPAHIASSMAVLLLMAMLSAPFAFVALSANGPAGAGAIDEKPMCYVAGVGCGAGPSMEVALFAPRR